MSTAIGILGALLLVLLAVGGVTGRPPSRIEPKPRRYPAERTVRLKRQSWDVTERRSDR
jgi:hypothetical protein